MYQNGFILYMMIMGGLLGIVVTYHIWFDALFGLLMLPKDKRSLIEDIVKGVIILIILIFITTPVKLLFAGPSERMRFFQPQRAALIFDEKFEQGKI